MKLRISHFLAKNIQINKKTRPVPNKVVVVQREKEVKLTSRESLAIKLNIPITVSNRGKVLRKEQRKSPSTANRQINRKATSEVKLLFNESKYAAKPTKPRSTLIEAAIKYEVAVLQSQLWRSRN